MIKEFLLLLSITAMPDVTLHTNVLNIAKDIHKVYNGALTITSNYRNFKRNKKYGGVWNSRHLCGKAVDIRSKTLNKEAIMQLFNLRKYGYRLTVEYNHIHIETREGC